jgi:hypothetical protein
MRVAQCEDLVVVRVRDGRVNGFKDRKLRGRHGDCAERTWGIVMWLEGSGVVGGGENSDLGERQLGFDVVASRGRYGRWGR